MTIDQLTQFFMWGSIINVGILLWGGLMVMCLPDLIYRTHNRLYPMPRETWTAAMFLTLALYKIGTFLLFVTPYIALRIIA